MSRNSAAMNPARTNRRFIMLAITLGLIGAVLVYIATSRDSTTSTSGGGGTANTPVVVAKADIPARTKITASMVEVRNVPADAAGALSFNSVDSVVNQITRYPISANEQLLTTKVITLDPSTSAVSRSLSFVVPQGKRGFAVNMSPVVGGGGLILPGDYIDIIVVYNPDFAQKAGKGPFYSQTIFQNVEVLAVALVVVDTVPDAQPDASGQIVRNSEAKVDPGAATVTLALTPADAAKLFLAEENGKLRFSVRHFGEGDTPAVPPVTEQQVVQ
jgi:pilus assembly protein CpaB